MNRKELLEDAIKRITLFPVNYSSCIALLPDVVEQIIVAASRLY